MVFDLIIIGGGPAGLTAGIYAQRGRLKTVLLEKALIGGQIAVSDIIENYPGFPSISGAGLMAEFERHARGFGLEIRMAEVLSIEDRGREKVLKTTEGDMVAKAVIVATGAKPKILGIPGEREFTGRGVSYCATCDGPFFKDGRVMVVGGGDTAVKEAIYLSRIAREVYIAHRRDQLRAEKIIQGKAFSTSNIEILWSHILMEIKGGKGVEKVVIKDLKTEGLKEMDVDGVFILIGVNPATDFVDVEKDKDGFIITNQNMETSLKGIYAVGDCRATPLRQVATAVGDGAIAAFIAERYIERMD